MAGHFLCITLCVVLIGTTLSTTPPPPPPPPRREHVLQQADLNTNTFFTVDFPALSSTALDQLGFRQAVATGLGIQSTRVIFRLLSVLQGGGTQAEFLVISTTGQVGTLPLLEAICPTRLVPFGADCATLRPTTSVISATPAADDDTSRTVGLIVGLTVASCVLCAVCFGVWYVAQKRPPPPLPPAPYVIETSVLDPDDPFFPPSQRYLH